MVFRRLSPAYCEHSANARRSLGESSASPRHRGVFASRTNKVRTGVRMRTDELRSPTPSPDDDCWLSRFANRARTLPPACTTRNAGCLGTGPRFMGSSLSLSRCACGSKARSRTASRFSKTAPWGVPASHRTVAHDGASGRNRCTCSKSSDVGIIQRRPTSAKFANDEQSGRCPFRRVGSPSRS